MLYKADLGFSNYYFSVGNKGIGFKSSSSERTVNYKLTTRGSHTAPDHFLIFYSHESPWIKGKRDTQIHVGKLGYGYVNRANLYSVRRTPHILFFIRSNTCVT